MNTQLMILAIIMLIAGIASIATSSIGIQAYNKCDSPKLKDENPKNFKYLVFNLILAIALVLGSFAAFFYASKVPSFSLDELSGSFDKTLNAARNA
jgi:formate hydrogenlyase subunit 3/multisubunit Na+/H+ antiporter MnhD subunit